MAQQFSTSHFLTQELNGKLKDSPEIFEGISCIYQLTVGDDSWHLDLTESGAKNIVAGKVAKADCRIGMSPENFEKLAKGKLNIPLAVALGKFKISGNAKLALKLVELFK